MTKHISSKRRARKTTAREQRELGLPADCTIETIDLHDPDLAPEHRERFIAGIRVEVARLDEQIGNWYRHRGECNIEGCDCGGSELAHQVETMCSHILAAKELFGAVIIDDQRTPYFVRFLKDCDGGDEALALLLAAKQAQ